MTSQLTTFPTDNQLLIVRTWRSLQSLWFQKHFSSSNNTKDTTFMIFTIRFLSQWLKTNFSCLKNCCCLIWLIFVLNSVSVENVTIWKDRKFVPILSSMTWSNEAEVLSVTCIPKATICWVVVCSCVRIVTRLSAVSHELASAIVHNGTRRENTTASQPSSQIESVIEASTVRVPTGT